MEKKTYLCSDCGCVFEEKNIIVNLKERLGKESFKSLLRNPIKRFSQLIEGRICPECGSDMVMEVSGNVDAKLPEYMISGWNSSLFRESMDIDEQKSETSEQRSLVKDLMRKTIDFFNARISDFKEKYNSSELMGKIASVAKKAGASTVYYALLIYYALMSDKVPTSKKVIAIAALGYFIAPVDFIPDFVLMGLLDDGSVLLFAINQILPYITDDVKSKALAKLHDWFGETDVAAIKTGLMPGSLNGKVGITYDTLEVNKPDDFVDTEISFDNECKESNNMVIMAPYRELNAYISNRFNQQVRLSYGEENVVKVTYTKRIVFNMSINVRLKIEEVKDDSVLLSYDVSYGLDSIIKGVLSYIENRYPALSAGLHPEEGHHLRISLIDIEQAKAVVDNIALRDVSPREDHLRIEFSLKVPK